MFTLSPADVSATIGGSCTVGTGTPGHCIAFSDTCSTGSTSSGGGVTCGSDEKCCAGGGTGSSGCTSTSGYFCSPMLNCNGTNEIKSVSGAGCPDTSDVCCGPKSGTDTGTVPTGSECRVIGGRCTKNACTNVSFNASGCGAGSVCCTDTVVNGGTGSVCYGTDGFQGECQTSSGCNGSREASSSCNSGLYCCITGTVNNPNDPNNPNNPYINDGGAGIVIPMNTGLPNPTGGVAGVLMTFMYWLLGILGFLALLAFIISGIQYLLAAGDEGMAETAKRNIKFAIIGLVVALSAWIIVTEISCLLGSGGMLCILR